MAGNNISMEFEELHETAGGFRNESEEVASVLGRADGLMDRLRSGWEGKSAEAFSEQYEELKPAINKLVELFNDIGTQLDSVADAVQEHDQSLAGSISKG